MSDLLFPLARVGQRDAVDGLAGAVAAEVAQAAAAAVRVAAAPTRK